MNPRILETKVASKQPAVETTQASLQTFVIPTVDYASTVWGPYSKKNIDNSKNYNAELQVMCITAFITLPVLMLQKLNCLGTAFSLVIDMQDLSRLSLLYKIQYNLIAIPANCLQLQQTHT